MHTLMLWFMGIPMLVLSIRFWWAAATWARRNQMSLGERIGRLRSAFADAMRAEE